VVPAITAVVETKQQTAERTNDGLLFLKGAFSLISSWRRNPRQFESAVFISPFLSYPLLKSQDEVLHVCKSAKTSVCAAQLAADSGFHGVKNLRALQRRPY